MKSKVYIIFSIVAHTVITFAGQQALAPVGVIIYYVFFDFSNTDNDLFLGPSIMTVIGYVGLAVAAALRNRKLTIAVYALATVLLLVGAGLLFSRNPEELSYGITAMSAIPYFILTVVSVYQLTRK